MEDKWNEIDEHLQVIQGNLGICCQDYCDAPNAIYSLEKVMDLLVDIREQIDGK
jgi:hypothetical protein